MLFPGQKPKLLLYEPNHLMKVIREWKLDYLSSNSESKREESTLIKLSEITDSVLERLDNEFHRSNVYLILGLDDLDKTKVTGVLKKKIIGNVFVGLIGKKIDEVKNKIDCINKIKESGVKVLPILKIKEINISKFEGFLENLNKYFSAPFLVYSGGIELKKHRVRYLERIIEAADKKNVSLLFKEKTNYFRIIGLRKKTAYLAPEAVSLDTSDPCNTNCIYCWDHSHLIKRKPRMYRQVPEDVFKKFVDELALHGLEWLEFSGSGEPFMHPKIMDYIRYASRKGLRIYVFTNGLLLDKKKIEELVRLNVGIRLNFSAASYETYKIIHPYVSEEKYLEWLGLWRYYGELQNKTNKNFIFRTENVMCDFNYKELLDIMKLSKDLGCTHASINLFSAVNKTQKIVIKDLDSFKRIIEQAKAFAINNKIKCNIEDIEPLLEGGKKEKFDSHNFSSGLYGDFGCYFVLFYARLFTEGQILPCTELTHEHNLRNMRDNKSIQAIDSLRKMSIRDLGFEGIWTSEEMDYLRKRAIAGNCGDSKLWPICDRCVHMCDNEELYLKLKKEYSISLRS